MILLICLDASTYAACLVRFRLHKLFRVYKYLIQSLLQYMYKHRRFVNPGLQELKYELDAFNHCIFVVLGAHLVDLHEFVIIVL